MDPIRTLDILGGTDVATTNCVLRKNKTELVARGTYDYCQGMRDEIVINRGFTLPPYYQEDWSFNRNPYWTPTALANLETWFSPEYFHGETNNPTLCVQLENQSTTDIASNNAVENNTSKMATLTTTAGRHRGLAVLDFDGASDRYVVNTSTDWNTGTDNWFCCIMLHGSSNDTDDVQHIVQKGGRFELTHDWSGSNKNAVFTYSDGSSSGTLTVTGGAQMGSSNPTIFSFGRDSGRMFLHVRASNTEQVETATRFTGDLSQTSKPKIGYESTIGTAKKYDGEFVELIFVTDDGRPTDNADGTHVNKVEGYLAHKYGVSLDILPTDHTYYAHPPRLEDGELS